MTTEVEIVPQTFPPASPTLEEQLLSRRYALAGIYYQNDGNSEKYALDLTLAITKFFRKAVGTPGRTIVWGASTGGTVALQMAELHPALYDGAIAVAPVGAGRARDADFMLQYDLAYAAAFGWPTDWWGPVEDVRDDLWGQEATLIMPVFQWAEDANYGQWEFVRLLMRLPSRTWWDYDESVGVPGYAVEGWKGTVYRSLLEQLCGGPVAQNLGMVYTLTNDEKAYLTNLGVNADDLLAWMNARRNMVPTPQARACVARDGTPTGYLRRPALTMHGMYDPVLTVSQEAVYRDLVRAAHRSHLLLQTYVDVIGHISFSAEQYLAELNAMEFWLNTGIRPQKRFFPESLGFDNKSVPPPWPY
jgi:pimeloyl-ACP methyl ester carboxylesterase